MNRRQFLLAGWVVKTRPVTLQVEVMEAFSASGGPAALLVHHANEATRADFAAWLRANSGTSIVCGLGDGTRMSARIFRVSMCFGRGLILTRDPVAIRARDLLSID